jgi:hemerythrin
MSPFEWRSELLLHIPEIDRQHQELVARASDLHSALDNAIGAAKPSHELQTKLSALAEFAEKHFRSEEKMMRAHGYDGYESHAIEHARLLEQIYLISREFSSGKIDPTGVLMFFMQNWTEQHILGADKQFAKFLCSPAG